MNWRGEKFIAFFLLSLSLVFFIWYAWASPGVYQGGDTFQHYLIARYAAHYPHLFLDHWGKPVFTTLYAMPAMVGYTAAEVFTAILGVATAWMTFLVARKLELKSSWSVVILVLFTPIFFVHLNSVMTEILFAFWLITGIYFIISGKTIGAAIFLSFLPFVRTEGFVLLPFIGLYFLMLRQWKPFFLLGTGFLIYSLAGGIFYFHDFLWVFNNNPYHLESPYGKGELFHFFKSNKVTWGIPVSIAIALALLVFILRLRRRPLMPMSRIWWMLVIIPFLVFLVFHSIAWATGSLASNGELRVIASTTPLSALLACSVFNAVPCHAKFTFLKNAVWMLFIAVVISTPFQLFKTPVAKDVAQEMTEAACTFVGNNFADRRIHYVDPLIPVKLNRDPYDGSQLVQWFKNPAHPEEQMKDGDLVIWDAHFTAHEGQVNFMTLDENPDFKRIALFQPEHSHIIFGDEEYFVAIFEYIRQR